MTEPSNAERIATLESAVAAMPPKKLSRRIILVETAWRNVPGGEQHWSLGR